MSIDHVFLALLAGHLTGDFVLQNAWLVNNKAQQQRWALFHVLIVVGVTWIFLGSISAWTAILPLALSHYIIDTVKIRLQKRFVPNTENPGSPEDRATEPVKFVSNREFTLFIADQLAHLISIILIWLSFRFWFDAIPGSIWLELWGPLYSKVLLSISGFALGIWGLGAALEIQMAPLAREVPEDKRKGLKKGGRIIGLLERTLVISFVLAGKPEAVAFVVAAKSVFRIGALTGQDDRVHAEYIMIGTLRSFTYALIVAFILRWLLGATPNI